MKKILIFAGLLIASTTLFVNSNKCNSKTVGFSQNEVTALSEDSELLEPIWLVTGSSDPNVAIICVKHRGTDQCVVKNR